VELPKSTPAPQPKPQAKRRRTSEEDNYGPIDEPVSKRTRQRKQC
jgi:hypothetical protein